MNIDTKISLYLERIGYNDNVEVSLKCLRKLQECHQSRVPFENLDVFTGRKKVLDNEILFEQIVIKRRGGWCHELNGLFCWLLQNLGFETRIVSCQYCDRATQIFREDTFDHMALIVDIENMKYLVDVGFGFPNQHFKPIEMCVLKTFKQVCKFPIFFQATMLSLRFENKNNSTYNS